MSPDFEKLARGRLEEMDSYNLTEHAYYDLLAENKRLRAELAALKPSWDDAPEWAEYLALDYESTCFVWQWRESQIAIGKRIQSAMVLSWRDTLERRPEATP